MMNASDFANYMKLVAFDYGRTSFGTSMIQILRTHYPTINAQLEQEKRHSFISPFHTDDNIPAFLRWLLEDL